MKDFDIMEVVAQIRANDKVGLMVFIHHGGDVNARNSMGWTLLHVACFEGKTEVVQLLLDNGAQVNSCTTDMRTPLHRAASQGCKGAVAALLNKKAYVNAQDKFGNTPLHEAAKGGFTSICKALIANKADKQKTNHKNLTFIDVVGPQLMGIVECGDTDSLSLWLDWDLSPDTVGSLGWSLMHHAAARGQIEVVRMLIKRGANVHIMDCNRSTPLHSAAAHGQKEIAKLFIKNGCDINFQDQRGNTPLHCAVSGSHADVINMLLEAEADVSITNTEGYVFHNLVKDVLVDCVHEGKTQQVVALLRGKADPNTQDIFGTPLLCVAAFKKDLLIVDALLEAGADPNLHSKDSKKSALHYAAFWDDLFIMKSLLEHKAKVDPTDKFGGTPLHEAAREGHIDVVTMLTGRRAALNIADEDGNTPLHIAARNGQTEVVELLLEKGANESLNNKEGLLYSDLALIHAVRCSVPDKVTSGLAWGGNPNNQDRNGWTLLHHAVYKENAGITDLLLECNADPNIRNNHGRTPLTLAAYRGNVEISRKLVLGGSRLDDQDYSGQTALHWGAREGSVDIVLFLIDSGADTSLNDNQGKRFSYWLVKHLYLAIRHNDSEKVDLLLAAGADQHARVDGTDVTPREEAKRRKCYLILKQLVAQATSTKLKIEEEIDFWDLPVIDDLRHLFNKGCSEDESSSSEDSDSEADWKMSNAEVVLRATEVFQEDKGELWEAWDEKPKWISKKELDEQDMQGFWENWDEKPKTLSAKECFKETWLDEEEDESSNEECSSDEETESSDENTESLLMRAEKYELSGGKVESLPSAKEFFKEDECWWRDAVEEVEEPKKVIKPIELFKDEEKPWWLKNESDKSSSSSDEESEQTPKQTLQTKDAVPAKEFFKEEECWWEEKPKVVSSKEMFKDELPWWQTEDENEFSLNKAVPAKDIFKEDTNWWEDNAAEDDEAYESIISNSSTMYSASEGTSDIFQETDYFSTSDKPAVVAKEFFKEDVWWDDDDCNDDKTDTIEDDSDDETQAESIVEEEIIETDSTESILTEDILVEPSEDASNCERNDQNLNFEADDENSEAVDSLNDDEISSIEESVSEKKLEFIQSDKKENSVEISSSNESNTNSDKSNKLNSLKNQRVSNSSPVVINRMDECLAELDARLAVADSQLKKIDSSSTTSFDSSSIDSNSIRDDKNIITTDEKPEKLCNMRDKFDVIKVSVRVSDKDDIKSTASDNNSTKEYKNQNESLSTNNTQKNDELFDHLINILTKDNNSDCASVGKETIEHNVNQEQYCSDSPTSESSSPIEINDSKPIPSLDDETMLSPYLSREVSIESDIATPNQLSKGIWRCSTYDNISISQFDKMASMLGQQEISGTDIDQTNPTLEKCTVHSDSESTVLSTNSTSSPSIQRSLSDSIEPPDCSPKTSKRDTNQKFNISRSSAPDHQSSTLTDAKKPMNSPKQLSALPSARKRENFKKSSSCSLH